MAKLGPFRYFAALSFAILFFKPIFADPNPSFAFESFGKGSNFESTVSLHGDAQVVNGGSLVEITGSSSFSSGRVFYRKPIKVVDGSPGKTTSFSTRFTFSMSPQNGDGLAFVVVPIGFPLDVFDGGPFGLLSEKKFRTLAVEFNTFMDDEFGDVNGNHVGVDLNSVVSVKVGNASFINLVLNNGEKLQSWIDYEAGSKRLAKLGGMKPIDPLVSCPIDLSRMWKEEEVFIGLISSNGNSSQSCNVHSWSFVSLEYGNLQIEINKLMSSFIVAF